MVGVRDDGALFVRTSAAPIDGAANRAVTELVAKALGIKRTQLRLLTGETARDKRYEWIGGTPEEARRRLEALPRI